MYIFVADDYDGLAREYCKALWRRRVFKGRGEPDERPWTEWPLPKFLKYIAEGPGGKIRSDTARHLFEDLIADDQARFVPAGYLCLRTTDEKYIAAADCEDAAKQFQFVGFNMKPEQPNAEWRADYAERVAGIARRHKENPEAPVADTVDGRRLTIDALDGRTPRSDTPEHFIEDMIAIGELVKMPDA
jgi:hypothetical protein